MELIDGFFDGVVGRRVSQVAVASLHRPHTSISTLPRLVLYT